MHDDNQLQIVEFTPLRAQIVFTFVLMILVGLPWIASLYEGSAEGTVGLGLFGTLMLVLITGNRRVVAFPSRRSLQVTATVFFGIPVRTDHVSYDDVTTVFLKEECETTVVCLDAGGKRFRLRSFPHGGDEESSRTNATVEAKRIARLLETRFSKRCPSAEGSEPAG